MDPDDELVAGVSPRTKSPQEYRLHEGSSKPNGEPIYEWYPDDFISFRSESSDDPNGGIAPERPLRFGGGCSERKSKYALIILNQPIETELELFRHVWIQGTLNS